MIGNPKLPTVNFCQPSQGGLRTRARGKRR